MRGLNKRVTKKVGRSIQQFNKFSMSITVVGYRVGMGSQKIQSLFSWVSCLRGKPLPGPGGKQVKMKH